MDRTITAERVPGVPTIMASFFLTQWVLCLGLAILAALTVMGLREFTGSLIAAYAAGIPAFSLFAYFLLFRRGMPMHWIAKKIYIKEPGDTV